MKRLGRAILVAAFLGVLAFDQRPDQFPLRVRQTSAYRRAILAGKF